MVSSGTCIKAAMGIRSGFQKYFLQQYRKATMHLDYKLQFYLFHYLYQNEKNSAKHARLHQYANDPVNSYSSLKKILNARNTSDWIVFALSCTWKPLYRVPTYATSIKYLCIMQLKLSTAKMQNAFYNTGQLSGLVNPGYLP